MTDLFSTSFPNLFREKHEAVGGVRQPWEGTEGRRCCQGGLDDWPRPSASIAGVEIGPSGLEQISERRYEKMGEARGPKTLSNDVAATAEPGDQSKALATC